MHSLGKAPLICLCLSIPTQCLVCVSIWWLLQSTSLFSEAPSPSVVSQAQAVTLTVAQAFKVALDLWEVAQEGRLLW